MYLVTHIAKTAVGFFRGPSTTGRICETMMQKRSHTEKNRRAVLGVVADRQHVIEGCCRLLRRVSCGGLLTGRGEPAHSSRRKCEAETGVGLPERIKQRE